MSKLYQVDVDRVPVVAVEFVKALRLVGRMSLREASDVHAHLVASGGGTVIAGVERAVAEHVARELGRAGAVATVAESSVRSPASCNPAAAIVFSWRRFRQLESA